MFNFFKILRSFLRLKLIKTYTFQNPTSSRESLQPYRDFFQKLLLLIAQNSYSFVRYQKTNS